MVLVALMPLLQKFMLARLVMQSPCCTLKFDTGSGTFYQAHLTDRCTLRGGCMALFLGLCEEAKDRECLLKKAWSRSQTICQRVNVLDDIAEGACHTVPHRPLLSG